MSEQKLVPIIQDYLEKKKLVPSEEYIKSLQEYLPNLVSFWENKTKEKFRKLLSDLPSSQSILQFYFYQNFIDGTLFDEPLEKEFIEIARAWILGEQL